MIPPSGIQRGSQPQVPDHLLCVKLRTVRDIGKEILRVLRNIANTKEGKPGCPFHSALSLRKYYRKKGQRIILEAVLGFCYYESCQMQDGLLLIPRPNQNSNRKARRFGRRADIWTSM